MAIISTRNKKLGTIIPGQKFVQGGEEPDPPTTGQSTYPGFSTVVINTDKGGGGDSGYYSYLGQLEKIAADQAAAEAATRRATQGAQYQANYVTGLMNRGIPENIINLLSGTETEGKKYINDQYNLLSKQLLGSYTPATNVGTGFEGAQGRTIAAYNALQNYLKQNQPQAFAQAPRAQAAPMTSDVMQYLAGQGVSGEPVQTQVDLANLAAQGGASNYNQLLDVLNAAQQQGQQSRLAEEQMGRSSALSGLQSIYQGQSGQLQQQQLQSLAELASNIANQKLAAENAAAARNQTLQDALGTLLGAGYIAPESITPTTITGAAPKTVIETSRPVIQTPPPVVAATPATPVEQLAAKVANIQNTSLVNKIQKFINNNPNASPAKIKKAFPKLGAKIRR